MGWRWRWENNDVVVDVVDEVNHGVEVEEGDDVNDVDDVVDEVNHGVELEEGEAMMDALGGFLIFVNRAGKIIYIHQQVANILGVQQVSTLTYQQVANILGVQQVSTLTYQQVANILGEQQVSTLTHQ